MGKADEDPRRPGDVDQAWGAPTAISEYGFLSDSPEAQNTHPPWENGKRRLRPHVQFGPITFLLQKGTTRFDINNDKK